jgi:uncharacterized heparinase superfamily protein
MVRAAESGGARKKREAIGFMARGLIAERSKLALFVARRGLHAAHFRINAQPLLRWRFSTTSSDRLLIAPQDLRTADPTRASEIYGGRFALAGKIVQCDGRSPFTVPSPSEEWSELLLGFGWLRHLRAAESTITRSNARVLVDDWITQQGSWHPVGWRPDVVGRRIVSWLTHAPFLLNDADVRFYRRFLRSLSRQVRYLRQTVGALPDGQKRLQATIALTYAALCMAGQIKLLKPITRRLVDELQTQILPDGGHISRNPGALIELLLDLLPLRQAFSARNTPPPAALINAIDRMMPMLRFFRHGDGSFANFNGMGPTSPDQLATVLAYDDARGRPVENAAHSGYQRIEAKGTLVLMDSGRPPPLAFSHEAHAGFGAIEFSVRRFRIVVNCGLPETRRDSWRHVSRQTAAHSTVTLNATSSCRFLTPEWLQRLLGSPIIAGPEHIGVAREQDAVSTRVWAEHDGYAERYGLLHERRIALSADGRRLDGEDAFVVAQGRGQAAGAQDRFAVRFHLHPLVRPTRLTHRHGIMLALPDGSVWTFEAYDAEVDLEDSVYLASAEGPRRMTQIVLHAAVRQTPRVAWSFNLLDPAGSGGGATPNEEQELPI